MKRFIVLSMLVLSSLAFAKSAHPAKHKSTHGKSSTAERSQVSKRH